MFQGAKAPSCNSRLSCKLVYSFLAILAFTSVCAQNNYLYTYQQLSHLYYKKQADSLKKAWACPDTYNEKAVQKKYREIWDGRTDKVISSINDDDYVYDKDIYNYLNDILVQLANANKQLIPVKPLLLLDRSTKVNAYAMGDNVIAVNIGLIHFAQTREELAIVLAHELSHNILAHISNGMKKRAEWLASDEYKQDLKSILDSKYERYTRLKKIYEGQLFDRNRHQRDHESDADSLAIVLLKQSNIGFDARFFLRLDSSDLEYKQPLLKPLSEYFTAYQLPFEYSWTQKRSKGLSTRAYNFKDTTQLEDSLKTHPDCQVRYQKTLTANTPGAVLTPVPASIQEKANKILIWNIYCNMNLTPCLYRILQEKDKGNTDEWYDFMLYNTLSGLFYADKKLNRFNAIGVTPKEYISKSYYELQTLLEQIPDESLENYSSTLLAAGFWSKLGKNETAFKNFQHTLWMPETTAEAWTASAQDFMKANETSPYCEKVTRFTKK